MSATLPVITTLLELLPLETLAVPEVVVKKRSLPWPTESVSVVVAASPAAPASTSAMLMSLIIPNVSSGIVLMLAGKVTVGASLTAVTLMIAVSDAVSTPPVPVLPPSATARVTVVLAMGRSLFAVNATVPLLLPASKTLICATVPESVTVCVPVLLTATPLSPAKTARTPP